MPPVRSPRKRRPAGRALLALLVVCGAKIAPAQIDQTVPRLEVRRHLPDPRRYLAMKSDAAPVIDGRVDDPAWHRVPWSAWFTDIEGTIRPTPRFRTRVKMMWDDRYWYVAAELQEPDLWATIREHDAVIFRDNDFEIFTDPSGTTHRYFEIEMNQFATVWDLFLPKPYRDEGSPDNGWNIDGLKIAVGLHGTINHPGDRDSGWTVELAIPWAAFSDSARNRVPPRDGDQWRVNFSRVEWDVDTTGGGYVKRTDASGKPLPEHNWVWSPQGAINMHIPEMWGVVQFGGARMTRDRAAERARWALRRVYYAERLYHQAHGHFAADVASLALGTLAPGVTIHTGDVTWDASIAGPGSTPTWRIRADGLITHD